MQLLSEYHLSLMIMESLQSLVAIVSLLLLILLPNLQLTTSNKTASFRLKLIHRDSLESPLYDGAMTRRQRLEWHLNSSESRALYWKTITMQNGSTAQPDMMRGVVGNQNFQFQVELEIGDPKKTYYLVLDTGSGLTWLQCEPCRQCFPQTSEIYDPKMSKTFHEMHCSHPFCRYFSCRREQCWFAKNYLSGQYINGYVGWETFHMMDENGGYTHVKDFLFGCSQWNGNFRPKEHSRMGGIMGLDRSPYSLITMLGDFIKKRFSYCLLNPLTSGTRFSYLKFGTDMGYMGGPFVRITPFVTVPHSNSYGLNLLDISFDRKRFHFPADTFRFKLDGSGGCIIDSGSSITYIQKSAYDVLEVEFVRYFSKFKDLVRLKDCMRPVTLCYTAPLGFPLFPSLTLHFERADLVIYPEHVGMAVDKNSFIIAIAPGTHTILGGFQQSNIRFTYDLGSNVLAFDHEDCSKDAA